MKVGYLPKVLHPGSGAQKGPLSPLLALLGTRSRLERRGPHKWAVWPCHTPPGRKGPFTPTGRVGRGNPPLLAPLLGPEGPRRGGQKGGRRAQKGASPPYWPGGYRAPSGPNRGTKGSRASPWSRATQRVHLNVNPRCAEGTSGIHPSGESQKASALFGCGVPGGLRLPPRWPAAPSQCPPSVSRARRARETLSTRTPSKLKNLFCEAHRAESFKK